MIESLHKLNREECNRLYFEVIDKKDAESLRRLCLEDLFFLLTIACKRPDANNDWVYARCREIEADDQEDSILDLWAREHYKSSIKTFAQSIQTILRNLEITIGIFSHTRPIAKAFLAQIKRELEINTFLQNLFPEVLYKDPQKEATKWSLDDGIIVKRKGNPKESTIEAWGLVDGQPTSKHYQILNYDDIVTKESVTTPEMIKKVTDSWALSLNLGVEGGLRRYSGTLYHQNDTYSEIIRRGVRPRYHYPTDAGKDDIEVLGKPLLMTREGLLKKRQEMALYIYSCQMLQNPHADKAMGFHPDWIEKYVQLNDIKGWNFYVLCDPASEKKKDSDYTVQAVIGLAPDGNYYLVDGVRDRMNLTERTKSLFRFVRRWNPKDVGYEKYGMQSDIEHIKYVQEDENFRFGITELGGSMPKNDRIRRLVPLFENRRFYIPHTLMFVDVNGEARDFIKEFIEDEYNTFPVSSHDDMLDCISRILDEDLATVFPKIEESVPYGTNIEVEKPYDPLKREKPVERKAFSPEHAVTTKTWRDHMIKK